MIHEDYGYAVARIRAMERHLLDAGMMQRMLDAEDLTAALKVLSETSYGRSLSDLEAQGSFESALENELLAAYNELQSFVADKELIEICRLPYDFHNVKVLLKSSFFIKSGGKKRWDLLTSLGNIPVDDLITKMEAEDYHLLPYGLGHVIPAGITTWEQTGFIVEVEKILDNRLFTSMLLLAQGLEEPGVINWVKARIDAENIRNLMRLRRFGYEAARVATFLHEGGTIAVEALLQLMVEPFESWGRLIYYSDAGGAIAQIQDNSEDFEHLTSTVEKTLDDYCQKILEQARFKPRAPENVLAYLWGKEMEIKNLRTILVSKNTSTGREEIRRLLRHGY